MLKILDGLTLRGLLIALLIFACLALITRTMRDHTALQALRAQCSLQAEALRRPATIKKANKTTTTTSKAITLTAQEKGEICAKYDIKIQALNDLLAHYREQTRVTQDQGITESKPVIPDIPAPATRLLYYSVLTCYNTGTKAITIGATRRILGTIEIGAGIDTDKRISVIGMARF